MISTKVWVVGAAVVILGGVGVYLYANEKATEESMMQDTEGAMEENGDAMMEKTEDVMMENTDDAMMENDDEVMMEAKGSYEAYAPEKLARAEEGDVVLFFRASWCPTCRALDADIRAHANDIPAGVTILDVDYDNATALKQQYGVTVQHTLVQVNSDGKEIAKWMGSPTLSGLIAEVK